MATRSGTLACKTPWTEEPGRLQSMGSLRVGHNFPTHFERLHFHFSLSCFGDGNGNPFQCSCLENPSDGGAWWASIYGVAQSRTWLKRLSMITLHRKKCQKILHRDWTQLQPSILCIPRWVSGMPQFQINSISKDLGRFDRPRMSFWRVLSLVWGPRPGSWDFERA